MVMVGILLILSSRPRSSRFTQPLTISHHGYDEIRRYISSEKEAVNFLLDKVGEPYITGARMSIIYQIVLMQEMHNTISSQTYLPATSQLEDNVLMIVEQHLLQKLASR
jgi:hypothetical protein